MKKTKEEIIEWINKILALGKSQSTAEIASELLFNAEGITNYIYGKNSSKYESFNSNILKDATKHGSSYSQVLILGYLKNLKDEILNGFVENQTKTIQGEIFGDFLVFAKEALDDNKNVAAVLACAAYEDTLKKYALQNDIDVEEKDLSNTINALKIKGLLQGPQATTASSYVKLRNKAFHAQWDKIDKPEVSSLIGFTEQFLLKHFC